MRPGKTRARAAKNPKPPPRLPGLRWVPVPLAVLAAVVGWLVLGFMQGQNAIAHAHQQHGYQAGGLALSVDQMLWMSNDMTGQGPAKSNPNGFSMPANMMPAMQAGGNDRLRVEVDLRNVTSDGQRYNISDFRVVGAHGKTWRTANLGMTDTVGHGVIEPGFQVTVDLYFDIPSQQAKNLSVRWSRDGTTVEFPVNTSGVPSPHHH